MANIKDKIIVNNLEWCKTVCESHGIESVSQDNVWGLLSKAPIYYPEIITTSRKTSIEQLSYYLERGAVVTVKDSYASLDLTTIGFSILFEAEWISREPVLSKNTKHTWYAITSEKDLKRWAKSTGLEGVIRPNLLELDHIKIFFNKNGTSGFIANLGANVVGISNVFSEQIGKHNFWIEIAEVVSTEFPGYTLVGYEQENELDAAKAAGWTAVGPLRVWIKN